MESEKVQIRLQIRENNRLLLILLDLLIEGRKPIPEKINCRTTVYSVVDDLPEVTISPNVKTNFTMSNSKKWSTFKYQN